MAQTVCILLGAEDRTRLAAIIDDRNRPQKHVQRAKIVLLSAERLPVLEVARRTGASRPAVWRGQQRFAATRGGGAVGAKAAGVSLRAVQRIWEAQRLQPHRIRTFKKSTDLAFAEKVEDVVGLYMNPPAHAVVVSIDEKSQIQSLPLARTGALDRTQPGLPMKPGKSGTMTHDYKRNGTTTLFAALNILDGTVVGRCMPSHTHREFIRFLNAVERAVPPAPPGAPPSASPRAPWAAAPCRATPTGSSSGSSTPSSGLSGPAGSSMP